jgi:hypothetical protein
MRTISRSTPFQKPKLPFALSKIMVPKMDTGMEMLENFSDLLGAGIQ